MEQIAAIAMGVIATGVSVMVAGLAFEAMLLMLGRALRVPPGPAFESTAEPASDNLGGESRLYA